MRAQRQPFQYKGQAGYYADAHTGLYYCHHRYYNPVLARWMSVDPIGLEGGFNVYEYCDGNPVNQADPSGLDAWRDWKEKLSFTPPSGLFDWWFSMPLSKRDVLTDLASWGSAFGMLGDFVSGKNAGKSLNFSYGSLEGEQLHKSLGFKQMLRQLPKNPYDGQVYDKLAVTTEQAFLNTVLKPWNGTQAYVGAFAGNATFSKTNGWGFELENKTGWNSLIYHIPSKTRYLHPLWPLNARDWKSGPFGDFWQRFSF